MKKFLIILMALFNVAIAQQPLLITTDKTTSLIFPFPIKYVDRGTKDILVQPIKENDNILLVKAASKQFAETNLSVVTADGNVYTFTVNYSLSPSELSFHLPPNKRSAISSYAHALLNNPPKRIMKVERHGVLVKVSGIYIKDEVIFYQLEIHNHSPIDYDIDLLQFVIKDLKKTKRTAIQENEVVPIYIAGKKKQVKAYDYSVIVVALEKFTIPDAKLLAVRINEKNGGRHFNLHLSNNHIMKAIVLPDLR